MLSKQLIKELRAVKEAILKDEKGNPASISRLRMNLFPKSATLESHINAVQIIRLIQPEGWPQPYCSRYHRAKTHITRAKVAAERIEHFIETGGEE